MAFTDRLVEYPNRYTMTDASGNTSTVYLEPAPGEVTQEQIDGAQKGEVCCPHCGRWSTFSILSEELPPWDMF